LIMPYHKKMHNSSLIWVTHFKEEFTFIFK